MNAGRAQFTEAAANLPGTSVKSEEKSVSDSAVYGSRNTFSGYSYYIVVVVRYLSARKD
jgi:hypothetical protein